jgi:hypothetical protein
MALLVGGTWNAYWSTPKAEERGMNWSNLLFGVVIVLLIIGFTIAAGNYQGDYQALVPLALALAGILIAGGLIYLAVFYLLRQPLVAFALIPATVFLLAFFLIGYILPVVELYKGTKILTLKVQPQLGQKTIVAAYDVGNRPSVVFYNPRPIVFLSSEADAATFLRQKKGYCYTQTTNLNRLSRYASPFAVQGDLCVFH